MTTDEIKLHKIQIAYSKLIGEAIGLLSGTKLNIELDQPQINNINEKIKVLQNISVLHIAD
jgi:hypothetical protein